MFQQEFDCDHSIKRTKCYNQCVRCSNAYQKNCSKKNSCDIYQLIIKKCKHNRKSPDDNHYIACNNIDINGYESSCNINSCKCHLNNSVKVNNISKLNCEKVKHLKKFTIKNKNCVQPRCFKCKKIINCNKTSDCSKTGYLNHIKNICKNSPVNKVQEGYKTEDCSDHFIHYYDGPTIKEAARCKFCGVLYIKKEVDCSDKNNKISYCKCFHDLCKSVPYYYFSKDNNHHNKSVKKKLSLIKKCFKNKSSHLKKIFCHSHIRKKNNLNEQPILLNAEQFDELLKNHNFCHNQVNKTDDDIIILSNKKDLRKCFDEIVGTPSNSKAVLEEPNGAILNQSINQYDTMQKLSQNQHYNNFYCNQTNMSNICQSRICNSYIESQCNSEFKNCNCKHSFNNLETDNLKFDSAKVESKDAVNNMHMFNDTLKNKISDLLFKKYEEFCNKFINCMSKQLDIDMINTNEMNISHKTLPQSQYINIHENRNKIDQSNFNIHNKIGSNLSSGLPTASFPSTSSSVENNNIYNNPITISCEECYITTNNFCENSVEIDCLSSQQKAYSMLSNKIGSNISEDENSKREVFSSESVSNSCENCLRACTHTPPESRNIAYQRDDMNKDKRKNYLIDDNIKLIYKEAHRERCVLTKFSKLET